MASSGRMDPLRIGSFILILGLTSEAVSRSASRRPSVSRSGSYSVSPSVSYSVTPSSLVPIVDPTSESPIILYISIPLAVFSCILVVAIVVQAMSYRRSIRLLSPNVRLIQSGVPVPPLDLNETNETNETNDTNEPIQPIQTIQTIQTIPSSAFSITNPMNRVQKNNEEDPVNPNMVI